MDNVMDILRQRSDDLTASLQQVEDKLDFHKAQIEQLEKVRIIIVAARYEAEILASKLNGQS